MVYINQVLFSPGSGGFGQWEALREDKKGQAWVCIPPAPSLPGHILPVVVVLYQKPQLLWIPFLTAVQLAKFQEPTPHPPH